MNLLRTIRLSCLTFILLNILFFTYNVSVLALPTHNGTFNMPTSHILDESLYSGIGLWMIIALVFSFLLKRFLHIKENKPDIDTKPVIAAPKNVDFKNDIRKLNEIKPVVKSLIVEKCLMD